MNTAENQIPVISKEQLFKQNNNIHIHLSTELEEFVGVLHKHKFIEIVYVVSGRATHIIGDKEYAVKRGDVSIINPDEAHAFVPEKDETEKFVAYDLMFTPDFVDNSCLSDDGFSKLGKSFLFYSLFPDSGDFKERFNLIAGCGYELGSVFEKIYDEYKGERNGYVNLIRLYIAEIVIRLSRKIENAEKSMLTSSQKQIVMEIISYIEKNYSIKIHSDEIASRLFFNKNYISRLFKKETGLSIHEFVRKIRMKETMKRLVETDDIISDIAADCGFNDMKSFYQMFKEFAGCTPKAYRDTHKKE
ncbi:MAG: helix-turn-helix domain-containing protein [Clostridia bacterium]|nr:helix-turn-helix domain-containing protein [Clostridia bacterium]